MVLYNGVFMKQTGTKKIKTERLLLRKFRPSDFFDAKEWYCDARTARFSQGNLKKSKAECLRWVLGRLRRYIRKGKQYYFWAIVYQGKAVGLIEMHPLEQGKDTYSVYYMIAPALWGNGLVPEAVLAVIEYMKTQGAKRIYGSCDSNNTASFRVLEKCGMEWKRRQENVFHYRDGRTGDREIFLLKLHNEL